MMDDPDDCENSRELSSSIFDAMNKQLAAVYDPRPMHREIETLHRFNQAYGERAMYEWAKRLPKIEVKPGEWSYCQNCNRLLPYQHEWRWSTCKNCGSFGDTAYVSWSSFHNPLQDYYNNIVVRSTKVTMSTLAFEFRQNACFSHSYAIPDEQVIRAIAELGPVVEMGAGRGYWAWMLQQVDCDVVAYDHDIPPKWHKRYSRSTHLFFPVQHGTPASLKAHDDRTLLLVWPPLDEPMGADCLRYFSGEYVVYIGEYGDCTGDAAFHAILDSLYTQVKWLPIPYWWGIHDACYILKRKKMRKRTWKKRRSRCVRACKKTDRIDANRHRQFERSHWMMTDDIKARYQKLAIPDELHLNLTRGQLLKALGEPTERAIPHRVGNAEFELIWKYGDIACHFNVHDHRVWLIETKHGPDGTQHTIAKRE